MTRFNWLRIVLLALMAAFASAAAAQANLEIDTPAIAAIKRSMQDRHTQLSALYASGAVGLTRDGNVALRDANAVPLAQRAQANALVASENRDRAALYREIAQANKHPEWESEIRSTFAQRWIGRAQPGWHYQNASGAWVKK